MMNHRKTTLRRFYQNRVHFVNYVPAPPQTLSVAQQIAQLEILLQNKWVIYDIGEKLKNIFLYDPGCVPVIERLFVDIFETQFCANLIVGPFKSALLSFQLSYVSRLRCFTGMLRENSDLLESFQEDIIKLLSEPFDTHALPDFCRFAEAFGLSSQNTPYTEITALIFELMDAFLQVAALETESLYQLANYCIYVTRGMYSACVGAGFFRTMLRLCDVLGIKESVLEQSFANNQNIILQLIAEGFPSKYVLWCRQRISGEDVTSDSKLKRMLNSTDPADYIFALRYICENRLPIDRELQNDALDTLRALGDNGVVNFEDQFSKIVSLELK